jgi:hypothetical protein
VWLTPLGFKNQQQILSQYSEQDSADSSPCLLDGELPFQCLPYLGLDGASHLMSHHILTHRYSLLFPLQLVTRTAAQCGYYFTRAAANLEWIDGIARFPRQPKVSFQLGKSSDRDDPSKPSLTHSLGFRLPALGEPILLGNILCMPIGAFHRQKAMYTVPCHPFNWMLMMRNRILTRYSPLGSGSGPIGALLMGSRTNWIAIYSP